MKAIHNWGTKASKIRTNQIFWDLLFLEVLWQKKSLIALPGVVNLKTFSVEAPAKVNHRP